jgi:hypothetical protein
MPILAVAEIGKDCFIKKCDECDLFLFSSLLFGDVKGQIGCTNGRLMYDYQNKKINNNWYQIDRKISNKYIESMPILPVVEIETECFIKNVMRVKCSCSVSFIWRCKRVISL